MHALHDEVGHWDPRETKNFVASIYWWSAILLDIHEYVKSCIGFQCATPIAKYRTDYICSDLTYYVLADH